MIRVPLPPSANNLFVNRKYGTGRAKSPRYRAWIMEAGWELRRQRPARVPGRVRIEIVAVAPGQRRDIDNIVKPILDLLVEHQVIDDDRNVETVTASWSSTDLEGVSIRISSLATPAPPNAKSSSTPART